MVPPRAQLGAGARSRPHRPRAPPRRARDERRSPWSRSPRYEVTPPHQAGVHVAVDTTLRRMRSPRRRTLSDLPVCLDRPADHSRPRRCHRRQRVHRAGPGRAARVQVRESAGGRGSPRWHRRQPPGRGRCPTGRGHVGAHQRRSASRPRVRSGRTRRPTGCSAVRGAVPPAARTRGARSAPNRSGTQRAAPHADVPGPPARPGRTRGGRRRRGHHGRHDAGGAIRPAGGRSHGRHRRRRRGHRRPGLIGLTRVA